jgi:cyanophycinase
VLGKVRQLTVRNRTTPLFAFYSADATDHAAVATPQMACAPAKFGDSDGAADGKERGWIIPIGGAEEKENSPQILRRFVQLAGGDAADIVVIPTASQLRDTGPRYERIFGELGAAEVTSMDFDTRRDAEEPSRLERLGQATGVFFTGGNQLRLSTLIGGTPWPRLVRERNAAGVPVAAPAPARPPQRAHDRLRRRGQHAALPGSVRLAPGSG